MPIVKKRKHAEEEDPTYEEEVSASEDDDSNQEEEILEEEEEEVGDESDEPSSYEEELPSTSKTLKEQVVEAKGKRIVKRKHGQVVEKKQHPSPSKKPKEVAPTPIPNQVRKVKKVVKKVRIVDKADENKKSANVSVEYNDKNVDYNLYNEAPEHIKNLKIKISSNVIMLCRMIEATGNTSPRFDLRLCCSEFREAKQKRQSLRIQFTIESGSVDYEGTHASHQTKSQIFRQTFDATTRGNRINFH